MDRSLYIQLRFLHFHDSLGFLQAYCQSMGLSIPPQHFVPLIYNWSTQLKIRLEDIIICLDAYYNPLFIFDFNHTLRVIN